MKKVLVMFGVLLLSLIPLSQAVHTNIGLTVSMTTEAFEPQIWMCDHRLVTDDPVETGRVSNAGEELVERKQNYAFEGEKIQWRVLVMDKNGIEKIEDVFATVNGVKEANCQICTNCEQTIESSCNARIGEEVISEYNSGYMAYYDCVLTVEPGHCVNWDYSSSACDLCTEHSGMHGDSLVTIQVDDLSGKSATTVENEYWFFNPLIAITIDGTFDFGEVRPGTSAYSSPILVGSGAECDSGVVLDMFVSGKDFYDTTSSGAKCPTSNVLELSNFNYHAVKGAYSTDNDPRADSEGYVPINYGDTWQRTFYDSNEILKLSPKDGAYYLPNQLSPGSELTLALRLNLPLPCNGDFNDGAIYFWGEAI